MFLFDENMDLNVNEEVNCYDVVMEGLLEEAGLVGDEELKMTLLEAGLLSERSIVRLDKAAHRGRAEKKAALSMAKQNNDPNYAKLVKVYKMKKVLIAKIEKKYGAKAKAEVRKIKFNAKGKVPMTTNAKENTKAAAAINKVLKGNSVKKSSDM